MVFTSLGSALRFGSNQTTDDTTAIDVRWRSHGLRKSDAFAQTALSEVWFDYESDSASSASVFLSSARSGSAFETGIAVSLISTNVPTFIPTWTVDSTPIFEVRLNDGGKPRFERFQVQLQDAGRFL